MDVYNTLYNNTLYIMDVGEGQYDKKLTCSSLQRQRCLHGQHRKSTKKPKATKEQENVKRQAPKRLILCYYGHAIILHTTE